MQTITPVHHEISYEHIQQLQRVVERLTKALAATQRRLVEERKEAARNAQLISRLRAWLDEPTDAARTP